MHPIVAGLTVALLVGAGRETPIYQLPGAEGAQGLRELWHYYGGVQIVADPRRPGEAGAPSSRVTFAGKTKAMVGIELAVEAGQWLRVTVRSAATLAARKRLVLCMKCLGADGKKVAWITFGPVPRNRRFGTLTSDVVEVPAGTRRAQVFLFAEDVAGDVWLERLTVTRVTWPRDVAAGLDATRPTTWGINDFFAYRYTRDPLLSDTCAKLMAAAGFTEARFFVWWGSRDQLTRDIQPDSWICCDRVDGRYCFDELDRQFLDLARYGLRPGAVVVHGTPQWASGKTRDDMPAEKTKNWRAHRRPFFPPRDWADWDAFVAALVSHFKGRVRLWEVGNEPNTPDSGLHYGHRDYATYLRRFYTVAKRIDPASTVLCGRVGASWLRQMLADDPGIVDFFDGLVSHPYAQTPAESRVGVRREQLVMAEAGVVRPIYVTEVGLGEWHNVPSPRAYERRKAAFAQETLPMLAKMSNHVYWWTSVRPGNQYGLLRDDGYCYRPMPAYAAAAKAIGRLRQAPITAEVTLPTEPVAAGKPVSVRLVATNRSDRPQDVLFWPVGFLGPLGVEIDDVLKHQWRGALAPGQAHAATFRVRPSSDACGGVFPLGLAVVCSAGNSLGLSDLHVPSIASVSRVSASTGPDPEHLAALNDCVVPTLSWDVANVYFVWPGRTGSVEWVQYEFDRPRQVTGAEVYWLDTRRRRMAHRVPASWRVLWREGDAWRPVANAPSYDTRQDKFNTATFAPVTTAALRLEVTLQKGFAGGIHEWRVLPR